MPAWHAGGRGFEPHPHRKRPRAIPGVFRCWEACLSDRLHGYFLALASFFLRAVIFCVLQDIFIAFHGNEERRLDEGIERRAGSDIAGIMPVEVIYVTGEVMNIG